MKRNEVKKRILKELIKDPCASGRQIAQRLGIHPATVIRKVEEMEKEGVIKERLLLLDLEKLGYTLMAVMQVRYKIGKHNTEEIMKLPNVLEVYEVTGEYDAIVVFVAKNREELKSTIHSVATMPNVERTNTSIILRVVGRRSAPPL